jgi:hypothetical protein
MIKNRGMESLQTVKLVRNTKDFLGITQCMVEGR